MLPTGQDFQNAKPFPHIVVDDLWDSDWLTWIAAEFPPVLDPRWNTYNDPKELGKRCGGYDMMGDNTKQFFDKMFNDTEMHNWISQLTGILPIMPDILGGGMHLSGENARLDMHVDFNVHPTNPNWERRINFLVFLNKDWDDKNGGVLYLGKEREIAVSPQFNRTVIFECSDISYHGHPDPIVGANYRKSLACYFYAPRRAETNKPHSTIWG